MCANYFNKKALKIEKLYNSVLSAYTHFSKERERDTYSTNPPSPKLTQTISIKCLMRKVLKDQLSFSPTMVKIATVATSIIAKLNKLGSPTN